MPQRGGKASLAVRLRGGWVLRKRDVALALQVPPAQDRSHLVYVVRMRNTDSGDWATLVKAGRLAARLSQQALADAVGVSRSTVLRWEGGSQKPENAEVVAKLAEVIREDYNRLMRAAGLALEAEGAPEPDPRLRGLDPNDPVLRRILSGPWDDALKAQMLDRLRFRRAQDQAARIQRELEEVEQAEEIWQRRGEGAA